MLSCYDLRDIYHLTQSFNIHIQYSLCLNTMRLFSFRQVLVLIDFLTFCCNNIQAAHFSQDDLARMWHQNGGLHFHGNHDGNNRSYKSKGKSNHLDLMAKKMAKEKGMFGKIIFKASLGIENISIDMPT